MAQSLLAHLYSHIRGSQEDVATLSLQYILSQSEELREGFNQLLGDKLQVDLSDVTKYTCQSVGKELERPDLSGKDKLGNEVVLCEAKFYAGLTENQPLAYLTRLRKEKGRGLVFICPKEREVTLWSKLKSLCGNEPTVIVNDKCIKVDGIPMAIITWREILFALQRISVMSVPEALSDLTQLDGYCSEIDLEAFIPFTSEELGAITAKKHQRFYQVIDRTVELILADNTLDAQITGNASTYKGGYERKIKAKNLELNIAYDERMWICSDSKETPFWLAIKNNDGAQTPEIISKLNALPDLDTEDSVWTMVYIALEPIVNVPLDDVAENLKEQIFQYIEFLFEE